MGGEWRTRQQKAGSSDEMGIARAEEAVYGSAIASTTPIRTVGKPSNKRSKGVLCKSLPDDC
jgi:hypothetical protein